MECQVLRLTCAPLVPSPPPPLTVARQPPSLFPSTFVHRAVLRRSLSKDEPLLEGLPKEYYDDKWQARQREKTKELHRRHQEEEEEEDRKIEEYREIGVRLKGQKIKEAAERGELTELVLMVIWNRLDLARCDTEILKRESSPAMRLVSNLLNLLNGFDDEVWLKECKKLAVDTFPREDPFNILVPAGFNIDEHQGLLRPPLEADDSLLRVDFVREVDALLQEVKAEQSASQAAQGLDPESVACKPEATREAANHSPSRSLTRPGH